MAVPEEIQEQVLAESTSATPNFSVDYNDERLTQWETAGELTKAEYGAMYDGMIADSDEFYNGQIQATKDWEETQKQIQQENTDFTIEKIEQEKEQANQDYLKEQSGAYVDWRKRSNQYGAEAEKMASSGLAYTGYSESSQVSMYNTYQNRIATAREVFNRAALNYNNAITEARLQNNAALAEIGYQSFEKQSELALQGFQYKNQLVTDKADKQFEIDNMYYQRWRDTLQQINTENAVKADIWKYQDNKKWETEQKQLDRDFTASENEKDRAFQEKLEGIKHKYNLERDKINNDFAAQEAEKDREFQKELENLKSENAKKEATHQYELDKKARAEAHQHKLDEIKAQEDSEIRILEKEAKITKSSSVGSGLVTGGAAGLAVINDTSKKSKGTTGFTGSTYSEAVKYMTANGVPNSYASGIMTLSDWSRRKNANSSSAHVKGYSSYGAYLKDIVEYNVETYGK